MSTILKFPLERVQRRSVGRPDTSHNAKVFVFEGVQYNKDDNKSEILKKKTAQKVKLKP
jgi:hypothetical protein